MALVRRFERTCRNANFDVHVNPFQMNLGHLKLHAVRHVITSKKNEMGTSYSLTCFIKFWGYLSVPIQ